MNVPTIAVICLGAWLLINGIAHDIAVLSSEHGKIYNRELLSLLKDGHILISGGAVLLLCFPGIRQNQQWAYYVTALTALSILIYCGMIFPFLKSFGTMFLSAGLLVILTVYYFKTF